MDSGRFLYDEGVPVALPDALHTDGRVETRRIVLVSVLLILLVAVAAGIVGTTHFSGARWVPHFSTAHRVTPSTLSTSPSTKPTRTTSPHAGGSSLPLEPVVWIIIGIVVAGLAILAWRWWTRRRGPSAPHLQVAAAEGTHEIVAEPEPEPDRLLTGIELALQVLDEQREPADAIVRAWMGLEETAQESGIVRRPAETPTEFTSGLLRKAFADDRAIQTLLRLYLRARFGDHPVTSDEVAAVREALGELVRTWGKPDPATAGRMH